MPARPRFRLVSLLAVLASVAACGDEPGPMETDPVPRSVAPELAAAPYDALVTRTIAGADLTFWPYTGRTPTIGDYADPINLILVGAADPRVVRARLLELDGNRGFPPPFDCTWSDAIGATQAVYSEAHGWSGSAVQLQCGAYESIRVHVRLFRVGDVTMAGAHLDVIIPGTTDHEVVSWEFARFLVMADLQRLGGAPVGVAAGITDSPTFRTVLPPIFAGLPAPLLGLLTTPPAPLPPSLTATGELLNDGHAPIFSLPPVPDDGEGGTVITRQTVEIQFDQVIPRPFCQDDGVEYLKVEGPVTLTQKVIYTPSGTYMSQYHAKGFLEVQQVAPEVSEPYRAIVNQHGRAILTDAVNLASEIQLRMEIRGGGQERGQLRLNVRIGPDGAAAVGGSATCKG